MQSLELKEDLHTPRVAYFSMEIALDSQLPTYSGGLGVLAGDMMRSAADLALPVVGVTLVSRAGYFRQEITEGGRQVEHPSPWNPAQHAHALPAKVAVSIDGRDVWIMAWLYRLQGEGDGRIPVLLLDADLPENSEEDRRITHFLYGGDPEYRLKQEIVLGIGGVRMLRALGFTVSRYHLNEGHAALLCLELLRSGAHGSTAPVRAQCAFTTHTPVEAGHDKFPYELLRRLLGPDADTELLRRLGGEQHFNMTQFALNLSGYVNGVAKSHAEVSRRMFPGFRVHAISNGVHPRTWTSPAFRQLYDRHFPDWKLEPEALMRIGLVDAESIWAAHEQARHALFALVRERCGVSLQEGALTLCFARRMTGYKRPDLLFTDLARLRSIARRYPLQLVIAGKAHPRDTDGKRLIEMVHACLGDLREDIRGAFIPDYTMEIAGLMTAGADVWLNTPLPPLEASGTSGMKAAFNGVPSLSVLDGWWMEGCIEGVTGWAIGTENEVAAPQEHARLLYEKLGDVVLPLFFHDRAGWVEVMKGTIGHNAVLFNSHRTMRRYAAEAYLRS
ncbi:alpha-glucan family phosphorylase [Noviherbaspirillum aridicola]|uniref:Alpha-glucan phosphorylase n=1 Tax=Noviherbaspirillum aridicola TaxID=2849687 RepID=A0ABQ4Q3F9_9BURK|nr:alpha-glucan family phosphorylase [Noviherbaspirillum aridicola]GIZ51639.1 alpha-glucan phosphorylase [Noviherbaspirillum aridicola]